MLLKEAELRVDDLTTVVVHVNFTNSSEIKVMMKHRLCYQFIFMQKKTVLLWWCISYFVICINILKRVFVPTLGITC